MPATTWKPVVVDHEFLYIEPISACNLECRMCYTNVQNGADRRVVEADVILDFARGFIEQAERPISIYWCGTGEVFLHKRFPQVVNVLTAEYGDRVTHIIQTNGTVNRLGEFKAHGNLKYCVSIDGPKDHHEWHRGAGTYDRTLAFCKEAVGRGCAEMQVRTLLTRDNLRQVGPFLEELKTRIGPDVWLSVMVPYTNRTLKEMRSEHALIAQHDIDDSKAVSQEEARAAMVEMFGPDFSEHFTLEAEGEAVTNYLSLNTYGVSTCCNGVVKIGAPDAPMKDLLARLQAAESDCYACSMYPCM